MPCWTLSFIADRWADNIRQVPSTIVWAGTQSPGSHTLPTTPPVAHGATNCGDEDEVEEPLVLELWLVPSSGSEGLAASCNVGVHVAIEVQTSELRDHTTSPVAPRPKPFVHPAASCGHTMCQVAFHSQGAYPFIPEATCFALAGFFAAGSVTSRFAAAGFLVGMGTNPAPPGTMGPKGGCTALFLS
jgi:hypothetical protein